LESVTVQGCVSLSLTSVLVIAVLNLLCSKSNDVCHSICLAFVEHISIMGDVSVSSFVLIGSHSCVTACLCSVCWWIFVAILCVLQMQVSINSLWKIGNDVTEFWGYSFPSIDFFLRVQDIILIHNAFFSMFILFHFATVFSVYILNIVEFIWWKS